MADSVGGRRGTPSDSVLGLVVVGGCLVFGQVSGSGFGSGLRSV